MIAAGVSRETLTNFSLANAFSDKSLDELERMHFQLQTEIGDISRKYVGLRRVMTALNSDYENAKHFPIGVRYHKLKSMAKSAIRSREYIAVWNDTR